MQISSFSRIILCIFKMC